MVTSNKPCFTSKVHFDIKYDVAMDANMTNRWRSNLVAKKTRNNFHVGHLFGNSVTPKMVSISGINFMSVFYRTRDL